MLWSKCLYPPTPPIHMRILMLNADGIRKWGLWKVLPLNDTSALIKEIPESSLVPSTM